MSKRGLVLEGGGAKGAYEYGCLLAFAERGIKFDAVAGTSIGAINGLIWAADKVREQRSRWLHLSEATVFNRRFRGQLLPAILLLFNHYRNSLRGLTHTQLPPQWIALPRRMYLFGTLLAAAMFLVVASVDWNDLVRTYQQRYVVLPGMLIVVLLVFDYATFNHYHANPWFKLAIAGVTWATIAMDQILAYNPRRLPSGVLAASPTVLIVLFYVGYWRWSRDVIFDNAPLRSLVTDVVSSGIRVSL